VQSGSVWSNGRQYGVGSEWSWWVDMELVFCCLLTGASAGLLRSNGLLSYLYRPVLRHQRQLTAVPIQQSRSVTSVTSAGS
jgi:hypothetical protein